MYKVITSNVKTTLVYLLFGWVLAPAVLAQQANFRIKSEVLQETREVIVNLPKNYDPKSKAGYPVFYMLDTNSDAINIAAQMASKYYNTNTIPEVILVGIKVSSKVTDFLPHNIAITRNEKQIFGNGDKALVFIKDELIPFISEKFRANERRALIGHSWAGQFSAYSLSQSPGLFDGYFITSPSIGQNRKLTFDAIKYASKQNLDFPAFIYVSVGESERPRLIEDHKQLTSVLKQYLPAHVKLHYENNEGATHKNNDVISFPKALKLYFSSAI